MQRALRSPGEKNPHLSLKRRVSFKKGPSDSDFGGEKPIKGPGLADAKQRTGKGKD